MITLQSFFTCSFPYTVIYLLPPHTWDFHSTCSFQVFLPLFHLTTRIEFPHSGNSPLKVTGKSFPHNFVMVSVLMNFPSKQCLNSENTAFSQLKMDLSLCKSTFPADSFVQYKLSLIIKKAPHINCKTFSFL